MPEACSLIASSVSMRLGLTDNRSRQLGRDTYVLEIWMDSLLRHRGETEAASSIEQPASDDIYQDDLSLGDSTEPSSNNTEIRDPININNNAATVNLLY